MTMQGILLIFIWFLRALWAFRPRMCLQFVPGPSMTNRFFIYSFQLVFYRVLPGEEVGFFFLTSLRSSRHFFPLTSLVFSFYRVKKKYFLHLSSFSLCSAGFSLLSLSRQRRRLQCFSLGPWSIRRRLGDRSIRAVDVSLSSSIRTGSIAVEWIVQWKAVDLYPSV